MPPLVLNINYLVGQTPDVFFFKIALGCGWLSDQRILSFSFQWNLNCFQVSWSLFHRACSTPLTEFQSIGIALAVGRCCISCQWDLRGITLEWRWDRIGRISSHLRRYIRKIFAFPIFVRSWRKTWCLKWWQPPCHPEEESWSPAHGE